MAATLTTVRDQIETRLSDNLNLIFPTTIIDEAIRASIGEISKIYGEM